MRLSVLDSSAMMWGRGVGGWGKTMRLSHWSWELSGRWVMLCLLKSNSSAIGRAVDDELVGTELLRNWVGGDWYGCRRWTRQEWDERMMMRSSALDSSAMWWVKDDMNIGVELVSNGVCGWWYSVGLELVSNGVSGGWWDCWRCSFELCDRRVMLRFLVLTLQEAKLNCALSRKSKWYLCDNLANYWRQSRIRCGRVTVWQILNEHDREVSIADGIPHHAQTWTFYILLGCVGSV